MNINRSENSAEKKLFHFIRNVIFHSTTTLNYQIHHGTTQYYSVPEIGIAC